MTGESNDGSGAAPQIARVMGTAAYPWGALVFDGANVTRFLERYSLMCADMNLGQQEKTDRLPHFCTASVAQIVKQLNGFKDKDWEKLALSLRQEYYTMDTEQLS